jgi:hypothetical protein
MVPELAPKKETGIAISFACALLSRRKYQSFT